MKNSMNNTFYKDQNNGEDLLDRTIDGLQTAYRKRNAFDRALANNFVADRIKEKTDKFIDMCQTTGIVLKNKTADEIVTYAKKYDKASLVVKNLFHSPRLGRWTDASIAFAGRNSKRLKNFVGRHSTKTALTLLVTGLLTYYNTSANTITPGGAKTNDEVVALVEGSATTEKMRTEQENIHIFGDYVAQNIKLQELDTINSNGQKIKTSFGKYSRFMRYEKEFDTALEEYAPSLEKAGVRGLAITEGEGNPASINPIDGGAGILHIQPDVAKKDFHMKVFTDNPAYKQYDFDALKKQGKSKHDIYAIHGKVLKQILAENDGIAHLASLDDRFHPKHCLDKVMKQLEKNYHTGVRMEKQNPQALKELKQYATDTGQDRKQLYALNAFNKGPRKGHASFTWGDSKKKWGHLKNVFLHTKEYKRYDTWLKEGIKQGKSQEELWSYLMENKHNSVSMIDSE